MQYIIYRDKMERRRGGFIGKVLSHVSHKFFLLNHFGKLFNQVVYWYLEINDAGKVTREIGFNSINDPICFGPWRENSGKWGDANLSLNPDQYEHLSQSKFVNTWDEAEQKRIMKRRLIASKARDYFEGRISWKEFFHDCHYEGDKLIDNLVDIIEHDPFHSKCDPSSHDDQSRETYDWEIKAMINELER